MGMPHFFDESLLAVYQLCFSLKMAHKFSVVVGRGVRVVHDETKKQKMISKVKEQLIRMVKVMKVRKIFEIF